MGSGCEMRLRAGPAWGDEQFPAAESRPRVEELAMVRGECENGSNGRGAPPSGHRPTAFGVGNRGAERPWRFVAEVVCACPRCDGAVIRMPRRFVDRLVSIVVPVHRFRCRSFGCNWEGNLREKR